MISDDKIIEIRERSSIVEVISDHLTLKKVGRNYLGLCPFHSEKTPSFTVNEEKGIFRCFGCELGGNVFNFLMHYEQLSFPESVERVAKRYGITVERSVHPGAKRDAEEKERLYSLNESAASYFHKILFGSPDGKRALQYLTTRGIEEGSCRKFYLGYAPGRRPGLAGHLQREGFPLKDAIRLGLLSEKSSGRYQDKFFDRLIFPIIDPSGRFVGFGGRVIGEGLPKYLNSSETPLFRKGSQIYGLFQAKEAIRRLDRLLVVEGYLDVLALEQCGVSCVVATLGTALTPDHVRILKRYTKNVVALFDGDEAGRKAAARSFEIFVEGGLLGKAACLPDGEDPDSFIRSRGKEALEEIIEQAIPSADYYFTWLQTRFGSGLEGKSQIAQEVSRVLGKVQNPFEHELLTGRAADFLSIREELLRRSSGNERKAPLPARKDPRQELKGQIREDMAESSLAALMVRFPSVLRRVEREQEVENLLSQQWKEVIRGILNEWRERGNVDVARMAQTLPPDQASVVCAITLQGENIQDEDCDKIAEDCLIFLRRRHLRGLGENLRKAIRIAEEKKDEKAKKERMLEWQEVVRKERLLERQRSIPQTENP
jgi:DNA primase